MPEPRLDDIFKNLNLANTEEVSYVPKQENYTNQELKRLVRGKLAAVLESDTIDPEVLTKVTYSFETITSKLGTQETT